MQTQQATRCTRSPQPTTQPGVFAREPRRRLIVQGATDTVVISLSGIANGTSAVLATRFGWVPFISIYMVIHGALLLLSIEFAVSKTVRQLLAWRRERREGRQLELSAA
jgi:hypothetical protein